MSVTGDMNVSETGRVSGAVDVYKPADVFEVTEEAVEGTDAVLEASVDKTVVGSDKADVEEVVVVLGVTLGNKPMTPAVVNKSVTSSPSSGQIPVVHGSLEQHP